MAFIRLYSGPDGESHFEEMDMGFAPTDMAQLGVVSHAVARAPVHIIPEKVKGVIIGSQSEEDENPNDFRPARRYHYLITLSGLGEIEVGSGDKRRFGPGDWLVDGDVTGRGHIWRILEKPWQWCAIILEE